MYRARKLIQKSFTVLWAVIFFVTSIIIRQPELRCEAAAMKNPNGIYLNAALVKAGAGSVVEPLEDWQSFLDKFSANNYYVGTPYSGWLYAASPNGDKWQYNEGYSTYINSNGGTTALGGMNCTGFVWHALMNALAYANGSSKQAVSAGIPNVNGFNSMGFTRKAWTGGANRWYDFVVKYSVHYYEFSTKAEMLSSGVLTKGDIIWCVDGSVGKLMAGLAIPASYHHIGIYMGDGKSDRWWQSGPTKADGDLSSQKNSINPIYGCAKKNTYVVIPFGAKSKSTDGLPAKTTTAPVTTVTTTFTTTVTTTVTTTTAPPETIPAPDPQYIGVEIPLGDVDNDGCIDSADASLILLAYAQLSTHGISQLSEEQALAADVDSDGCVDATDASAVLSYYSYTSTGGTAGIAEFVQQPPEEPSA